MTKKGVFGIILLDNTDSYENPFLQETDGYMETWHQPDFYERYLTVGRTIIIMGR